jgi:hypothetical protein
MIDRDLRILELPVGVEMSYAEFGNLGRGSRHRCLVTLAAGLGVVERAESIGGDVLDLLKKLLVSFAPVRIGKSVAQVVESGDCFRRLARGLSARVDGQAEQDNRCDRKQ